MRSRGRVGDQLVGRLFFVSLASGTDPDAALTAFHRLALHLPGFGGWASFCALTQPEVDRLLQLTVDHLRAQAAALKKGGR